MKACLLPVCVLILVAVFEPAHAQFRLRKSKPVTSYFINQNDGKISTKKWSLPGLARDKDAIVYKPASPVMHLPANTSSLLGDSYWVGSVTSQSYNQGKIGRYYYWDIQGNLRGSYLFVDIAGKNKRGLKLVFPKHRALF